jgi:hypothetical protein
MDRCPERLLDAALPRWNFTERHAREIQAPLHEVWRALAEATMGDLPLTRALMRLRRLGHGSGGSRDRTVLDALPPGELARREPYELLLGLVAPTSLRVDARSVAALRPADVDDFDRSLPDGWIRVGTDFRLTPDGPGTDAATRLETETRVLATGPRAKRRFAVYWFVIRPGSGLIRREMLRAVARRAEAAGG